jgi:hypothetical protein
MSFALHIPDAVPGAPQSHPPYKLSENELRLRSQFVATFTASPQPAWELQIAVWDMTDDLKAAGELAEGVVKRIKYIAAIPISFHYRAGYRSAHSRLADSVSKAISLSIARYYADAGG